MLVFFTRRTSGPCRRMQSLVAWVKVTERRRLRVVEVDADRSGPLMERLGVREVPALVLVRGQSVLGRLEGRTTGQDIDALIQPHLPPRV